MGRMNWYRNKIWIGTILRSNEIPSRILNQPFKTENKI